MSERRARLVGLPAVVRATPRNLRNWASQRGPQGNRIFAEVRA